MASAAIDVRKLWESLPEHIGATEADLDTVLLRIAKIRDGDYASLGALRLTAIDCRLVVRDDEGQLVRSKEFPTFATDAELLAARQQQDIKEFGERVRGRDWMPEWSSKLMRVVQPDEPEHSRFLQQHEREKELLEVLAPRFDALQTEIRELREQVAGLINNTEMAAA